MTSHLEDREALRDLFTRYANSIDAKDFEGINACLTEDVVADYSDFAPSLKGRDLLDGLMRKQLEPLDRTQHIYANFVFDIDGDAARVKVDIMAQHVKFGAQGGDHYLSGGRYNVQLKRGGDGWKMAHITAGEVWGMGNKALLSRSK